MRPGRSRRRLSGPPPLGHLGEVDRPHRAGPGGRADGVLLVGPGVLLVLEPAVVTQLEQPRGFGLTERIPMAALIVDADLHHAVAGDTQGVSARPLDDAGRDEPT